MRFFKELFKSPYLISLDILPKDLFKEIIYGIPWFSIVMHAYAKPPIPDGFGLYILKL